MKPPYDISPKILSTYGQITHAIGACQALAFAKPEARLRKQNRIKTIHASLAIEGNTLALDQVTALMENARVIGPKKDIVEVQNAIKAYEALPHLNPFSLKDFLKAHKLLMDGLVESNGRFRSKQVGITNGLSFRHVAPSHSLVPGHMRNLFDYLKNDSDLDVIKSCVFHYEMEFIHPFEDGNGRMGRFWQTRILMNSSPIFEFVPVEDVVRSRQDGYYKALGDSDLAGNSTKFIEFMLEAILVALTDTLDQTSGISVDYEARKVAALGKIDNWFDRKDYMKINKGISSATASRDLKRMLVEGLIEAKGEGRMMTYKKFG